MSNNTDTPATPLARMRSGVAEIVALLRGPLVWAAHFAFAYGFQSTACTLARGAAEGATAGDVTGEIRVAIWLATAVALAPVAWWSLAAPAPASRRDDGAGASGPRMFHDRVARTLALLSAVAILAVAVVASIVDPCAPLR